MYFNISAYMNINKKYGGLSMAEIKFEIEKEIGSISESPKGWAKELNLISWNGKEAKYDLRDWAPGHEKMGKGVTLSIEELKKLKELLNNINI
ncbi:oxidoreductase, YhhX family [Clostridium sp. IBUN13A]|nr:oxidoreductase, YhhX family [Clostridium sp. IBUN13A]KJZ86710.1 hypothetical protein ClosIBUN125C_CONTIG4g00109 [Clostridium sp. IBUN125C]